MKKLFKTLAAGVVAGAPLLALAQNLTTIEGVIARMTTILATVIPFIMALAVVVILWGIFNYIIGAGDEEKRGEARQYIIWGVIGLFVMGSIWGLVNILGGTFLLNKDPVAAPGIPVASGIIMRNCTKNGVTTQVPVDQACP